MELLQSHALHVSDGFGFGMEPDPGFLEQPKVVAADRVMGEAENRARGPVDDESHLQGATLFLARVAQALVV